jgi:dipeptidyl-peptidase-4
VWLITSRTGEHLAVVEARRQVTRRFIIDGKGLAKAKAGAEEDRNGFQAPDGSCVVTNEPETVSIRQVTIVESSPKDRLQPKRRSSITSSRAIRCQSHTSSSHAPTMERRFACRVTSWENPFTRWKARCDVGTRQQRVLLRLQPARHQLYRILAVNAKTGAVRVVVEETSKTFIHYSGKSWRHWLHSSGELIWMSERDGWCHLWLYDAQNGQTEAPDHEGAWPVREVLHVDEARREIWFLASGLRKAGEDPYHLHLCRVNFDGSGFKQLTAGDGNHRVEFSPKRDFFIDTWSRADHPPVTELRRSSDGSLVCDWRRRMPPRLLAAGWTMPERFVAKGRDGKTDIHGVIIKPSKLRSGEEVSHRRKHLCRAAQSLCAEGL